MYCPMCHQSDSRVIDSRNADEGLAIRRRRECTSCGHRYTTMEAPVLMVTKRSGVSEPFSREKVIRGVRRACQGRDISGDQLHVLAHKVELAVRAKGVTDVPAHDVGLAILEPLRELDEVGYLRFASVYKSFESAEDFEHEIAEIRSWRRAQRDSTSVRTS